MSLHTHKLGSSPDFLGQPLYHGCTPRGLSILRIPLVDQVVQGLSQGIVDISVVQDKFVQGEFAQGNTDTSNPLTHLSFQIESE